MRLQDLIKELNYKEVYGKTNIDIKGISINSKNVIKGSLFAAVEGFKYNGHNFVNEAVASGAVGLIVQKKVNVDSSIAQVIVNNTREALPVLCRNFYKDPTSSFKLIGVTGTNGKTTTCYLINSILKSAGLKTSLITTVESFLNGSPVYFDRTTPESTSLNIFFDRSKQKKVDAVCMDCLLYTSPSPRDLSTSRMPSSA